MVPSGGALETVRNEPVNLETIIQVDRRGQLSPLMHV